MLVSPAPMHAQITSLRAVVSKYAASSCSSQPSAAVPLPITTHCSSCTPQLQLNWFFLSPEFGVHKDVTRLVLTMCSLVGASSLVTKTPLLVWLGAPVTLLDGLAKAIPEFYSYSTAGTPEACMHESMCGPQVRDAEVPSLAAEIAYACTGGKGSLRQAAVSQNRAAGAQHAHAPVLQPSIHKYLSIWSMFDYQKPSDLCTSCCGRCVLSAHPTTSPGVSLCCLPATTWQGGWPFKGWLAASHQLASTSFMTSRNSLSLFACTRAPLILAHMTGIKRCQGNRLCLASSACILVVACIFAQPQHTV